MFNSWERQAAECLTNAQHMREECLRRQEQERAEGELKQQTRQRQLPAPPLLNKHRARTYERPWANITTDTKKVWPPLPARPQTQELAVVGTTQRRAPVTMKQLGKGLSPSCHKQKLVNEKNGICKMAPSKDVYTLRRTQSRRHREAPSQEIQKEKPKTTPSLSWQALSPIPGGQVPICDMDSSSFPLPLSSPDWTPVDWALMSSLHCRSPSPVNESDLQLISDPFQESLNESGVGEDIDVSESSGSRILHGTDFSESSGDSGISHPRCPSNNGGIPENSLRDQFCSLDLLPSQYVGDDDLLPARLNPGSGGDPSPPSCSPLHRTRSLVYLEPPVRLEARFLGEMDRASFRGGYSPVPPITEAGPLSSLAMVAERTHRGRLPALNAGENLDQQISDLSVAPTRVPWDQPRTELGSAGPAERSPAAGMGWHSSDGDRREEREEGRGASLSGDSVGAAFLGTRTSGLLDHLALVLMALQEVRREVVQIHLDNVHEGSQGAAPETKPPANPETLRRITESLLEEESDEEDGDLCRICQSLGGTPQNPLLTPCQCTGSLQYVHHDCLKRWIQAKVQSGAELTVVKSCELCKASLNLDLEGFDLEECYRQRHTQVEQANPELHVLRLLQQRLWDVVHVVEMRSYATFNVATTLYLIHQTTGNARVRQMVASPQSESDGTGHQRVTPSEETPDP
ncbi:hypothetical protein SKAU_G00135910 [Synaphobranchus kaupii]|uniref:RING-type E3 ubiquitin transferase n=1 Tax=Synaphobranchus kaupii TaxID=118154 RepID=A0A9Q1J3Y3_SYNKA|nr:hypothetical protein SKAU_G00135910 [Synaphobranchus kaupii]